MCGIWGCFRALDSETLREFFERISARGPDYSTLSTLRDGSISLGFHRLAIVGLGERGNQPFTHGPEENHSFVCSGEIYNWNDLCADIAIEPTELRSDVDVITRLLHEDIENPGQALSRLDGDWAFIDVDKKTGIIIAGRDPLGVRPLFYGLSDGGEVVAISSEAKGIVGLPGVADTKVFPPGTWWRSDMPNSFHTYSDIYPTDASEILDVPPWEAAGNVRNLLDKAVRKRVMHSEVPLGFLCSGGLDSSAIVAIAKEMKPNVASFSMGFDGAGRSLDAYYAGILTTALDIDHTPVTFTKDDIRAAIQRVVQVCETHDPQTIRASVPMYLLARHIRDKTPYKVILSGEGADEIFGGYSYFSRAPDGKSGREESTRLLRNLHSFDLLRADRCFAAHGLEIRVPFLDKGLIRYVLRLPYDLTRVTSVSDFRGQEKQLLRNSVSDLESLNTTRICDRAKERFSDGVSFSYVPNLLRVVSPDHVELEARERAEKKHYGDLFDAAYGEKARSLILPRVMPDWIPRASKLDKGSILCMCR